MTTTRAGRHFDAGAKRFDLIYEEEKPFSQRLVDRLFRRVIQVRYEKFFERYPGGTVRRVLDVGCGSGRYAGRLHREGAEFVLGIDEAPAMISIAREQARRSPGPGTLDYVVGEFLAGTIPADFDLAVAIGYFDYTDAPHLHLRKIREHLAGPGSTLAASFPKKWTLRTPIRKARLALRGCPVYFYTKSRVEDLLTEAGFPKVEILNLSRDFLVFASL